MSHLQAMIRTIFVYKVTVPIHFLLEIWKFGITFLALT